MRKVMKIRIAMSSMLLILPSIAAGQAVPTAVVPVSSVGGSPIVPNLDGELHYAVSGSQIVQLGYYGSGEVTSSTALSGDLAYTAKSTTRPFSLIFAGGVLLPNQSGQGTSSFWNVAASQGYTARHWIFNISDSFSFLPQSPTTGLSGIPGVGDLGSIPVQGPVEGPAGGILTVAGNRVQNTLSGSVERQISHATSISGSGSWSILNFLDSKLSQLDSTNVSGSVALNQRFDARSSGSIDAVYSTFTYSGNVIIAGIVQPDIETRALNASYQRLLSKSLSVQVAGGPLWINSSNELITPASLNVGATANVGYSRGFTNASVNYSRGVNGGSGVLSGALSDSVYASVGHTYGREYVASLTMGYSHSSGLAQLPTGTNSFVPVNRIYDTFFGGAQLRRAFGPHLSGYVSYTVQSQSDNLPVGAPYAVDGTSHTFGIGVTFTPRSTRLGQF
jgi:hypothetical protein